ncbi:hypothetical protein RISK_000597 [Rhodopirellula islandica]|uniref:Uncharacterized protein n=1 Tax=Rhodopirellula islandica TaxID=595434 RepID=A0A0J1EPW3_RHOIS|nr:hypothetical protein RISK_000597 [Rhodopirellula islandica]
MCRSMMPAAVQQWTGRHGPLKRASGAPAMQRITPLPWL